MTKQAENDFVNVKIKGQLGTDAGKRYPLKCYTSQCGNLKIFLLLQILREIKFGNLEVPYILIFRESR